MGLTRRSNALAFFTSTDSILVSTLSLNQVQSLQDERSLKDFGARYAAADLS
jgi:hypothetical protein